MLQGGYLEVDLMEEEALQLVVRVVIQPVRASCAVCASRLNANYLQDVTLFSGPLRHDVHLCVHRHYNECWAKRNSHGLKTKGTAQTNTHVPFPLQPTTSGAPLWSLTLLEGMSVCARVSAAGGERLFVWVQRNSVGQNRQC